MGIQFSFSWQALLGFKSGFASHILHSGDTARLDFTSLHGYRLIFKGLFSRTTCDLRNSYTGVCATHLVHSLHGSASQWTTSDSELKTTNSEKHWNQFLLIRTWFHRIVNSPLRPWANRILLQLSAEIALVFKPERILVLLKPLSHSVVQPV